MSLAKPSGSRKEFGNHVGAGQLFQANRDGKGAGGERGQESHSAGPITIRVVQMTAPLRSRFAWNSWFRELPERFARPKAIVIGNFFLPLDLTARRS
jgi:hypothetical protein